MMSQYSDACIDDAYQKDQTFKDSCGFQQLRQLQPILEQIAMARILERFSIDITLTYGTRTEHI